MYESFNRSYNVHGPSVQVVTYNTLIDAYGKTGQWAEALKVPARMKVEVRVPPLTPCAGDDGSYCSALLVGSHGLHC